MCGIAGVVSRAPLEGAASLAVRLDRALAHRGPDDGGTYESSDGRTLLVHRRLSIIDLSKAGHQPMATPDRRHWLVYNGEIYNFRLLRSELERAGERFHSDSDTEVLLRLLVIHGPSGLGRLRGMFALAWWDQVARSLVLARDRFGIKPLYVAARAGVVAFASEIRALLESGLVPREIDAAGVLAYLRWASIPPPLTWVAGVEALAPGTWRRWSLDGDEEHGRFADARDLWVSSTGGAQDAAGLRARVREAVEDSVRAHLVADVPVGVFLSGGIDSAALVATARPLVSDLRTYTVVVDEQDYSEAEQAAATARHFGTTHHTLRVDAAAITRDWPAMLARLDQPTADGLNTYYVARAVAATGVKAVLSGVGGDELFGGYPSFTRLPRALRFSAAARPLLPLAARAARVTSPAAYGARLRQMGRSEGAAGELYRALRGCLMPGELDRVGGRRLAEGAGAAERVAAIEQSMFAPAGCETPAATTARLESVVYLRSQLLRDIDAMSMAHALEVRVPFVDHRLTAAVWPELGAHPALMRGKRLLTESLPAPLPADILRRPKRGFTLPFARWMDGPLASLVRSGLADLAEDGWIAPDVPDAIWRDFQAGRLHWSRPWTLGVLGRFLRDA